MIRRTKEYILENKMIKNHSTVLVALSGGADSVCLLLLLNEIKRQCADELDFALEAVHVEHGIRGAESREDARFASDLCERLTYRAMYIPWMYRNMQQVMDSDWRRPPGYCAMKRLKRRQADIPVNRPMHQTQIRITGGR